MQLARVRMYVQNMKLESNERQKRLNKGYEVKKDVY